MKPTNASTMRSSSDQLSVDRHIPSLDELTFSFGLSQSRMFWRPSDSAGDPQVKWQARAVRTANRSTGAVPHAVAATGSVKFGCKHSGQGDFVKLIPCRQGQSRRLSHRNPWFGL